MQFKCRGSSFFRNAPEPNYVLRSSVFNYVHGTVKVFFIARFSK